MDSVVHFSKTFFHLQFQLLTSLLTINKKAIPPSHEGICDGLSRYVVRYGLFGESNFILEKTDLLGIWYYHICLQFFRQGQRYLLILIYRKDKSCVLI